MALRLRNTTDIPDSLISLAVAFSIAPGVELTEIIVKNKAEGKLRGQWGWYFPASRRIVLIVPQTWNPAQIAGGFSRYSKRPITISSRAEFVIAVMAHELRHAWQYQMWPSKWAGDELMVARELDAEYFEHGQLDKFRSMYGDVQAAASKV